jgi:carboxypeptidase family protein
MRRSVAGMLIVPFVCLLVVAGGVRAQTATGQITGTVKDASGALVAKARIKVDSASTGLTRETTTNGEGVYVFPLLPVGIYAVTVEQQGFRAAKKTNISINVDQIVRADFDLTVGELNAVVEVQSTQVALDTETASMGQIVSQRQVTQLPLNGRNYLQLLFLNGGTVETTGEQGAMRQGAGNAISINGARPTSNNYLLDGTSNTDTALGTPSAILSVDAIQEFKEQTGTYSAEYGFSANQVNVVSKTGTNDLHGSAFWFGRNDALDANLYFNNAIPRPTDGSRWGGTKNKLRQNQYGFVAGGPVWVPKVYNGRNRSFWLANFEGQKTVRGRNWLSTFRASGAREEFASKIFQRASLHQSVLWPTLRTLEACVPRRFSRGKEC